MCTHSEPNLSENCLIPIKDLMNLSFVIPSYQRGYRWDEQQAMDLLEDLYAFINKDPKDPKEIYCLQPLVVSGNKEKSKWRVVDGQQRLTTIYLLLKYLEEGDETENTCFSIKYERDIEYERENFLKNIKDQGLDSAIENVDYYHLYIVYHTIDNWFDEKKKTEPNLKDRYREELLKEVAVFL